MNTWMKTARSLLGTREAPGSANNSTIISWVKGLGTKALGIVYNADSVPWCGVFVGHCIKSAGLPTAPIAVRASSWATWGQACAPTVGAVVVFKRPGGGHVGFLVGQDDTRYRVLGGNQGDAVTETWIEKARAVAVRWPAGQTPPTMPLPKINAKGATSSNEA